MISLPEPSFTKSVSRPRIIAFKLVGVSPTARRSPTSGMVMLPSGRIVASVVSPGFSHTLIDS